MDPATQCDILSDSSCQFNAVPLSTKGFVKPVSSSVQEHGWKKWLRKLWPREDPEVQRRKWLLQNGRIVEGIILDMIQNGQSVAVDDIAFGAHCTVYYRYQVSGVTYESCQTLDTNQMANLRAYVVGSRVSVRYHPGRPGNAIVV